MLGEEHRLGALLQRVQVLGRQAHAVVAEPARPEGARERAVTGVPARLAAGRIGGRVGGRMGGQMGRRMGARHAEIHHADGSARPQHGKGIVERRAPVRNHGERIGEVHAVHRHAGVISAGVGLDRDGDLRPARAALARHVDQRRAQIHNFHPRQRQHARPEEIQVAAGAAAQFDYHAARRRRQALDQFLPPMQQAFAKVVVALRLRGVEALQRSGMVFRAANSGAAQHAPQHAAIAGQLPQRVRSHRVRGGAAHAGTGTSAM